MGIKTMISTTLNARFLSMWAKTICLVRIRCAARVATMTFVFSLSLNSEAKAQRQMESLSRGVVAINQGGGHVFLSWRLLGNEPSGLAFNVYRTVGEGHPKKLNALPLTNETHYTDNDAELSQATEYTVRPVLDGKELEPSVPFRFLANAPARPYLTVPLRTPAGYSPNDCAVGDLDGDGEYELVVHMAGRGRDNSQAGITDAPIFHAYRLDGKMLWQINLGKNIREGAHYTQFIVYDLDGDGRAELVCKTADGTIDGTGKVIGDSEADWRGKPETRGRANDQNGRPGDSDLRQPTLRSGYILEGPEYLTVFDGLTGEALATSDYLPARGKVSDWGDAYGNRVDRFLACVAYLDGQRPSVVMCRGYYTRTTLVAWDWRDGKLTQRWFFDSDKFGPPDRSNPYRGQGNHNLSVADIDADGKDEIIYGAMCVDDDGKPVYSTKLGHGDALHVSDMDPSRPGLEVFDIHEKPQHPYGMEFRDARTGEMIWGKPGGNANSPDVGRGCAMDIDPRHHGYEMWGSGGPSTRGLWNVKGERVSEGNPRSCNFGVWWDGDLLRELLNGNEISKWNWETSTDSVLMTARDCQANNGSKSTPCLSADLFGDWREEVIWRTRDNLELRIYTTTVSTEHRLYTLMHDPQYRLATAWQNVAYNQPPHPGFFLGHGMQAPPQPQISTPKSQLARP